MTELQEYFDKQLDIRDGFSRVDWEAMYDFTAKIGDSHELWNEIADMWVSRIASEAGDDYVRYESDNFLLLSSTSQEENKIMLGFLEWARKSILSNLAGVAADEGFGKHVVFIFADSQDYYRYVADCYEEGQLVTHSAGMYINRGYGHFAMTYLYMDEAKATLAHELTHALLAHLPIPLWLNEGLAVGMENLLSHSRYTEMDVEMLSRHQQFWNKSRIEEFKSGKSFSRTDDGQELSYHLGEFAVNTMSKDYASFVKFANLANWHDGGGSAIETIYGGNLDNILFTLFGKEDHDGYVPASGDEINRSFEKLNQTIIYIFIAMAVITLIALLFIMKESKGL